MNIWKWLKKIPVPLVGMALLMGYVTWILSDLAKP